MPFVTTIGAVGRAPHAHHSTFPFTRHMEKQWNAIPSSKSVPARPAPCQSNTQDFWNACAAICDERDWRMSGSFFDGKGQPSQVSAVSHGTATTRFDGINVINTGRKIG
jgi:hypothetical protein